MSYQGLLDEIIPQYTHNKRFLQWVSNIKA